jgi:CRP-like cAMP-binding protein
MALQSDIENLRQVEMFSTFTDDQLRLIAFNSQKHPLPAESDLFHHGQNADGGYVVVSGEVMIELPMSQNKIQRETFGPGGLIGEMALLTRTTRVGNARTTEKSELVKIRRSLMMRLFEEYPELAEQIRLQLIQSVSKMGNDLEKAQALLPQTGND